MGNCKSSSAQETGIVESITTIPLDSMEKKHTSVKTLGLIGERIVLQKAIALHTVAGWDQEEALHNAIVSVAKEIDLDIDRELLETIYSYLSKRMPGAMAVDIVLPSPTTPPHLCEYQDTDSDDDAVDRI